MDIQNYINFEKLDKNISEYAKKYKKASPFPHIIIEDFLKKDCINNTLKGFKNVNWTSYNHFNEKKSGNRTTKFDPSLKNTIEALNSKAFLQILEELTGIKSLIADKNLGSGGVHRSTRGGFLNIHADFTTHPYNVNWQRRVNVLIYLNEEWEDSWGGKLELWDKNMSKCITKITPTFNKCVIFNTDYDSFHGHPEPMKCPKNIYRKSIALYYYTKIDKKVKTIATNYKPRPKDKPLKKLLIFFDRVLVGIFHYLKTKFRIKDRFFTRILDFFNSSK